MSQRSGQPETDENKTNTNGRPDEFKELRFELEYTACTVISNLDTVRHTISEDTLARLQTAVTEAFSFTSTDTNAWEEKIVGLERFWLSIIDEAFDSDGQVRDGVSPIVVHGNVVSNRNHNNNTPQNNWSITGNFNVSNRSCFTSNNSNHSKGDSSSDEEITSSEAQIRKRKRHRAFAVNTSDLPIIESEGEGSQERPKKKRKLQETASKDSNQ